MLFVIFFFLIFLAEQLCYCRLLKNYYTYYCMLYLMMLCFSLRVLIFSFFIFRFQIKMYVLCYCMRYNIIYVHLMMIGDD